MAAGAGDIGLLRALVAASRAGTIVDEPAVIPAATLRRALMQPPSPGEHPTGQLHLQGVTIEGDLDLRGSTLGVQLTLIECEVRGGLNLLEATLPGLQLDRTTVSWVDAANCVITLEVWIKECSVPSGIDFTDARVGGSMHLDGSVFGPDKRTDAISVVPHGCPVRMRRLTIGGMLSAPRTECFGTFDLANSRIGGDLELDSARLVAPEAEGPMPGTALNAPELRIDGSLTADNRHERARRSIVHAGVSPRRVGSSRSAGDLLDVTGRLYLPGVVIGGMVDLSAARLSVVEPPEPERHGIGPGGDGEYDAAAVVVLDRAEIRGNVELDAGFRARGSVRLSGAEVGGDLRFDRSSIGRPGEAYAIVGNGVVVRGHVSATDAGMAGEICLQDARVQHSVHLQRTTVRNAGGNAVNLHRARVGGTVDCGRVEAEGSLRMADMTAGSVFVSGATLREPCLTDLRIYQPGTRENRHDPLLNLIGAEITGTLRGNPAGAPFRARGSIALRGARISRSVQFIQAEIVSEDGLAVDASSMVCSDLYLSGLDAVGGVRLTDARIDGDADLTRVQLRWNEQAIETLRTQGRPEPSVDAGAASIGGDLWFDGARAEGLVRLRRTEVRRSVGLKDVVLGALAIHCAATAPSDVTATGRRALLIAEATADAAEAAHRVAQAEGVRVEAARAVAERSREEASAEWIAAFRAGPPPPVARRRRRGPELPATGLLVLDLAGLHTPDLVVAPGRPLHGNVDMSRTVVISFTDNANLWRATHLDLHGLEYQVHIDLDARPGTADWHTQIRRFESTKILPPPSTLRTDVALPTGQLSQPYLQLAAIYRATGSDSVARRILYEMRRREWAQRTARPAGPLSFGQQLRRRLLWLTGFLYRITVGYGYRLQLALVWLLGLWLAGFLVFAFLAPDQRPVPRAVADSAGLTSLCVVDQNADPVPDQPGYCGSFSPALYTTDLLVPVVDLGQKSSWHYRNEALQVVADVLQVAGWILATAAATAALGLIGRGDSDRR